MKASRLNVQYRRPDELIPYVRNARTHSPEQVQRIAASIKEFGFTNPILIDGENGIIAGHGRLAAAQLLKLESVPTIELKGLTETQKRAYIIADNKLALDAGWDEELLKLDLKDISESGLNIELTGYSAQEVENILTEKSYLDSVIEDNFSIFTEDAENDVFSISLSFKEEYREKVTAYIKKVGKEYVQNWILEEAGAC